MFAQCIHLKNPSNQLKQRLIAQIQICSSVVGSTTCHFTVLPVREFWQFGPWWIPKLRNQPVFRLNLEIPSVSCPLEFFAPCGVKQPNIIYAVSSANFYFQHRGQNPIRFFGGVHWLDACVPSRIQILECNACRQ